MKKILITKSRHSERKLGVEHFTYYTNFGTGHDYSITSSEEAMMKVIAIYEQAGYEVVLDEVPAF